MKTRKILTVLLMVGLTGMVACNKEDVEVFPKPRAIELTTKSSQIIQNSNSFGIDLFSKVATDDVEAENLMISPLSASIALTMALNGADGNTASQMRNMLGYASELTQQDINEAYLNLVSQLLQADDKVNIAIANALFFRLGFDIKPTYLNTISTNYDATIRGLDFGNPASVDIINQWAADNTNDKIKKVIDQIDPMAAMFLMNALYFKGSWTQQFDKDATADLPFSLADGTQIQVPTMMGETVSLVYNNDLAKVLELPYGRKNFSMVIIVPNNDLDDYIEQLTPDQWETITGNLDAQTEWYETNVIMPKFSFDYETYFNNQLEAMGMTDAFSPTLANFSPISDTFIYINFVKQNTFVDVNEEGTEAAAVTTIGFETTSVGPSSFTVDKPFVFAIRERTTNTLMFIGKVENPL